MGLEDYLNPEKPNVGLQKYARELVEGNELLLEQYRNDPETFRYRINRVLDTFVKKYSILLDKDALRDLSGSAAFAQGVLENSPHAQVEPTSRKGKLLLGVLLGLPSFYSTYNNVRQATGDSSVASLEVSRDVLERFLPFGESITGKGGYILEKLLGGTPIQKHLNYRLRDSIFNEFGLSPIQARTLEASRRYDGVKDRKNNIIRVRESFA